MTHSFQNPTAEFIDSVFRALPDMPEDVMSRWLKNPEALNKALTEVLCPPRPKIEFQIWKSITVGTLGTAKVARRQLKSIGVKSASLSRTLMRKIPYEESQKTLDLALVTPTDLGITGNYNVLGLNEAAMYHGLTLCPPEVGVQLWLQYPDLLSEDQYLNVAMKSFIVSDNDRHQFVLHMEEGVRSLYAWGTDQLSPNPNPWVFVRNQ